MDENLKNKLKEMEDLLTDEFLLSLSSEEVDKLMQNIKELINNIDNKVDNKEVSND